MVDRLALPTLISFLALPQKRMQKRSRKLLTKIGGHSVVSKLQELAALKQLEAFNVPQSFPLNQFLSSAFILCYSYALD